MLSDEDKIHLIHECHTILLNRMFDELSRRPGSCREKIADEVIVTARAIQDALCSASN